MSWGPTVPKDCMKMEDFNSAAQFDGDNNKKNPLVSFLDKATINNNQKTGQRLPKHMSQTINLFRKYLITRVQHGKTNVEESEAINRSPPQALLLPKVGCSFSRHPSFLEQQLLPNFRHDVTQPTLLSDKSSKAQLTIFYSGAINVYDNVPVDKAQAIMLLAGEGSLKNPTTTTPPSTNVTKSLPHSNSPSVCKFQAGDFPIARKQSLQRFLEKRHQRIISKTPYASPSTKHEDGDATTNGCLIGNQSVSPSPFPSHLGCFFPISAHKA
ncbi:hypothetical protein HHK36_004399 [Tetracentron sinense]|uniref:Protein TIFY n=1 Tax=Tetracentron sinense TaxID=13715 RepID=A0A834ZUC9_TETSI|nr:hypothetical protein HHK36_004399 [Tetracentron sinense]